jgi:hypothetical protein
MNNGFKYMPWGEIALVSFLLTVVFGVMALIAGYSLFATAEFPRVFTASALILFGAALMFETFLTFAVASFVFWVVARVLPEPFADHYTDGKFDPSKVPTRPNKNPIAIARAKADAERLARNAKADAELKADTQR